jgi:threonine aldolase
VIDLRSDTVTKPTREMRAFLAAAEVGDEQRGEDPSVNELVARVADLLGMETGMFLPSATMANAIALMTHCVPGDEIIVHRTAHTLHFESGGLAALAGAMHWPLDGPRGTFTADQVRQAVRRIGPHYPRSRLVWVENTHNQAGGSVWPLEQVRQVVAAALEHGLSLHLDGARLLNAVVATGTPAVDFTKGFASVTLCLSKGLGAPVGAVLAGSRVFTDRARRFKHLLGGAMRQAGLMAAAGTYALSHHVARLAQDHEKARALAARVGEIPGVEVLFQPVETNMLFLDTTRLGLTADALIPRLKAEGVLVGPAGSHVVRAVTHMDVSLAQMYLAAEAFRTAVSPR